MIHKLTLLLFGLCWVFTASAQKVTSKKISSDLFGIFFEDISYAADGGLYAELVQNRSFEYTPADRKGWHSLSYWEYLNDGYGYGNISVESSSPLNANNPHYLLLNIEEEGQKGVGIANLGYDGIVIRAEELYDFSIFIRQLSDKPVPISISLQNKKGDVYGETSFSTDAKEWKKYTATIKAKMNEDSARLVVRAMGKGKVCLDMISLFPQKTFKNRKNGLRADIAQAVADIKPRFMRFPGGCLVHGDGVTNIYRWKNTIGPVEQRVEQRNIWNYHQTFGLGYFEYFQFCEDIGATPLPVVAAGVSCQNSGGTWRIGGTGQRGIPDEEMQEYIQEINDLIEYANGPVTSTWGAKRSEAGHPQPFNLQYIGIGNEDKQTDLFRNRFEMIYRAVKAKHPEIIIIGTVGPFYKGEDFDLGWQFANQLTVPMVDEHYYENPGWFLGNNHRYDTYDRDKSKVYLGEYASRGNTLYNALAEAAYMTSLERNGDVVTMASYAPLLANQYHTSWNPNLVYFSNTKILLTANYYVQQLFSENSGDTYCTGVVSFNDSNTKSLRDTLVASSCVRNSQTGDVIIKLINADTIMRKAAINISVFGKINASAICTVMKGDPKSKNSFEQPGLIVPDTGEIKVQNRFTYELPASSFVVIRIKPKK